VDSHSALRWGRMRSLRVAFACLVLASSVAVTQVSAASGPDASAAKKCKKPYVKKRGKCKFTPKQGLYKSKDGSVSLTLKTIVGGKYVNLFRGGPATLKCKDGSTRQESIEGSGVRALLRKASFKTDSPDANYALKGKFTSAKAMKGTFEIRVILPGANCTSGPIKFSAKFQ